MQDDRIARLESRLAELEDELAALRAERGANTELPGSRVAEVHADDAESGPAPTDRRALLRALGVAGAAAAAGTVSAAVSASPAAADDGDTVLIGRTNVQNQPKTTYLNYAAGNLPDGENVLTVQNGQYTQSDFPAAVGGYGSGAVETGVYGYTESAGYGVVGSGVHTGSIGVFAKGLKANLRLPPTGAAPSGRVQPYSWGDVIVDSAYDLWFCVGPGTPGVWRRIGGPDTVTALKLHDAPRRAYDSRAGFAPLGVTKGQLLANQSRDIDLKVANGVPEGAIGALVNLTATGTSIAGFLQIYKAGAPPPAASAINWDHTGTNVANNATVALSVNESCTVRCGGGGAASDFIVDVVGYYV